MRRSGLLSSVGVWGVASAGTLAGVLPAQAQNAFPRPRDIVVITVDDMNWNSTGFNGNTTPGITPHIDRLASQGLRFEHAHVPSPVCMPTRQALLTGRYPINLGAPGFAATHPSVPTLPTILAEQTDTFTAMFGKLDHHLPLAHYPMDRKEDFEYSRKNVWGRSPQRIGELTRETLAQAREQDRPVFLKVNILDPHRPFAGQTQEKPEAFHWVGHVPPLDPPYTLDQIAYPPMLAPEHYPWNKPGYGELPAVATMYYDSVRRADASVGAVLEAMDDAGIADEALVFFFSDNGMPFQRAKMSAYTNGTKTPLVVRWPGHIQPGSVDRDHVVNLVDLTPTLLDLLGLEAPQGMDGRSFAPLLFGQPQENRDHTLTMATLPPYLVLDRTTDPQALNDGVRSLHTTRYTYVWNAWHSPGQLNAFNQPKASLRWYEQQKAPGQLNDTLRHFYEPPAEQLFDHQQDPDNFHNLAQDPAHAATLASLRESMMQELSRIRDPLAARFAQEVLGTGYDGPAPVAWSFEPVYSPFEAAGLTWKPMVRGDEVGPWYRQSGELRTGGRSLAVAAGGKTADASVEAQVRVDEPMDKPWMGPQLLLRRASKNQYYAASLQPTGQLTLLRFHQGQPTTLGQAKSNPCSIGEWATLKLSATGDTLTVTLNGEALIQATDPQPLPAGDVGLRCNGAPAVSFKDVQATGLKPRNPARDDDVYAEPE